MQWIEEGLRRLLFGGGAGGGLLGRGGAAEPGACCWLRGSFSTRHSLTHTAPHPRQTFIAFPSTSAAVAFRERLNGQTLPHGVAAHSVRIKWAVPFKDRRMPEPGDSVAATAHVTVPGPGPLLEFVTE